MFDAKQKALGYCPGARLEREEYDGPRGPYKWFGVVNPDAGEGDPLLGEGLSAADAWADAAENLECRASGRPLPWMVKERFGVLDGGG